MSEHKPPKKEQGKSYPQHKAPKHMEHQPMGPHMPPPPPHMNKGMEHNKGMENHHMPPQMGCGCTGQGMSHPSECMGPMMNKPHMGHGCMPHMEKPMHMQPKMPMQQGEHKQQMYEQCVQYMNQKVNVQTVKGHQFNAVIEHLDADNVYFILMDEDGDNSHGERAYGYGGGIGRLIIPLIFLSAISGTGGWGW